MKVHCHIHLIDFIVTNFELPKVEDLKLMTISYDADCTYLDDVKDRKDYPLELAKYMKVYCAKIAPHITFYKKQVDYYNWTAYEIITNEVALILPTISKQERQKRGIITSLITGFISLVYEGISSFLHYKRQKALHKAVWAMENKVDLQCNKIFHLEDSVVLYSIYDSDTLQYLIDTVHRLHNKSTWNEKLCGRNRKMVQMVFISKRCTPLCNKFIAFPNHCKRKYVKTYEKFIN